MVELLVHPDLGGNRTWEGARWQKVSPPEALGKVSRIGERAALSTKPVSVSEPAGYYYKRFTLPLPRGVTVPAGCGSIGKGRPSVKS